LSFLREAVLPRETRLAINQNLVGHPNIITLTASSRMAPVPPESIHRGWAFWAL
jgi:hypothetical protein